MQAPRTQAEELASYPVSNKGKVEIMSAKVQNPVVIARLALTKLATAALPPTPNNYAKEYRRAAGLPDHSADEPASEALAAQSASTLLDLIETVGHTTNGLVVGINRFDGDLKAMFDDVDQLEPKGVRALLDELTVSRRTLQNTLEASSRELDSTRQRLEQVTGELERSRAQARIDPLTGTANRRAMEEVLGREIACAGRAQTPLSLAMLDIDHFKRVNDECGHDVGDQALIHLAAVVKSGLRETDVICRYGGEEFVIVLPGSAIEGALFVVERLRVMVEKTPLIIPSGKLQIRFSAGIAEWCGAESLESVIKRADEALFAAKRAGRNRVLLAQAA